MRSWDDYKKTIPGPVDVADFRGFTPLMLASYRGNLGLMKRLLTQGANPNLQDLSGSTPLMGVAFKGNVSAAQLLLSAGADLFIKNKAGLDAFEIAASFNQRAMLSILSQHGAPVRTVGKLKTVMRILILGVTTVSRQLVSILQNRSNKLMTSLKTPILKKRN